ncbi:hypothetical protein [Capnocytophaga canimorsus]|uniref:hypothetical protein n=1 Tax=Capnocytophaga canimorsus TaxID=28188 RepID=UPI000BB1F1A2|nr:hypothetical protein [Capnocytophaga canimorsus]ATA76357.1 hypothetical protein CGC47_01470 [Capnocytophaga canimorsus]PJI79571.1 hypothetical protein CLV61_1457 [Capnocytophaga canimorsus]STA71496.1 Uncharacterised protein [Capnocytophaga canimorsus]
MFLILFLLFSAIVYLVNQSKKIDEGFVASDEQKEPYYDFPCCVTKDYVRPSHVPNGDTSGGPTDTPDVPDADSGGSDSGSSGGASQGSDDSGSSGGTSQGSESDDSADSSVSNFFNSMNLERFGNSPFVVTRSYISFNYFNVLKRKMVKHITNFEGFKLPHNLEYYNQQLATLLRTSLRMFQYNIDDSSVEEFTADYSSVPLLKIIQNNSSGFALHMNPQSTPLFLTSSYSQNFYELDLLRQGRYVAIMGFHTPFSGAPSDGLVFEPKVTSSGSAYFLSLIGFTDEQEAIKFVEIMANFTKEASEYETASSSDEGYSGHTEDPQGYATMGM